MLQWDAKESGDLTADAPVGKTTVLWVKAGGMRIVQKHPHSGDTKEEKDKDEEEWETEPRVRESNEKITRELLLDWCLPTGQARGLQAKRGPAFLLWSPRNVGDHSRSLSRRSDCAAYGDKDFPPAAAQVAHQKPHASMDKYPSHRTQHIQQPRK
ncbi:Death-associated protein 1 [Myotis davidii]|uniref:Death-associated protein 1 n=1 Tax=Myotis davidii TaxID=225400 RepID=L5LI45_MYODS|nr:Death-associated protein 1 [Myotis davidii]